MLSIPNSNIKSWSDVSDLQLDPSKISSTDISDAQKVLELIRTKPLWLTLTTVLNAGKKLRECADAELLHGSRESDYDCLETEELLQAILALNALKKGINPKSFGKVEGVQDTEKLLDNAFSTDVYSEL